MEGPVVCLKKRFAPPKLQVRFGWAALSRRPPMASPPGIVMSSTGSPSLHRFVPRRALETTAFGYEVIAKHKRIDQCISTVQWIDCWCPDAAQFILVDAPDDLGSDTCQGLIHAIDESHLRPKIRLVCNAGSLADAELVAILHRHEIGFLLVNGGPSELSALAEKGILGVRVDAEGDRSGRYDWKSIRCSATREGGSRSRPSLDCKPDSIAGRRAQPTCDRIRLCVAQRRGLHSN